MSPPRLFRVPPTDCSVPCSRLYRTSRSTCSPQPVFRPSIALIVDRDDFDRQVVEQGFVADHRAPTTTIDGLVFRNRS